MHTTKKPKHLNQPQRLNNASARTDYIIGDSRDFPLIATTKKAIKMAFKNRDMSVIAYANGFTLWHYASTEHTLAEIVADGFFNPVNLLCAVGDIIIINGTDTTGMRRIESLADKQVKLTTLN